MYRSHLLQSHTSHCPASSSSAYPVTTMLHTPPSQIKLHICINLFLYHTKTPSYKDPDWDPSTRGRPSVKHLEYCYYHDEDVLYSHSCPGPTSRGRAGSAAVFPYEPGRSTWPALLGTKSATVRRKKQHNTRVSKTGRPVGN